MKIGNLVFMSSYRVDMLIRFRKTIAFGQYAYT
jgi:hypothetical protein